MKGRSFVSNPRINAGACNYSYPILGRTGSATLINSELLTVGPTDIWELPIRRSRLPVDYRPTEKGRHKFYAPGGLPLTVPVSASGLVENSPPTRGEERPEASYSVYTPLQPVQDTTYAGKYSTSVYACKAAGSASAAAHFSSPA
jgi:hypothetical protein